MTTVEALREVYKSLGGTGTDIKDNMTIPEALVKIATKAAGVELPAVTAENAGQVLTVNAQGKWVAANIPSQLPAVTATDNGSVLKVVEGVWAVGTDEIQA